MRSATIKLIACIMVIVMLLLVTGMPVKANTNEENIILKKGEQEFLIYYKDICKQEFQFAISIDENAKEAELNFRNSVKDQLTEEALNVAYIDATSFTSIFGGKNTSTAYVWIKDLNDQTILAKSKINLNEALDDEKVELVENTTKANEATNRIQIDTTQIYEIHPEVEGITTTVRTGKIVVKENKGSKYYYSLIKVSDENSDATEMYKLAETMATNKNADTYEKLSAEKRFYELYEKLTPAESDWTEVENSEILQPETARTGDKYIVYIKEANGQITTVDAKLLVSKYDYEEKRVKEEDKVITETVKLPVTFDSGAILFTVLGIIIIALAILIFIRVKSNKKAENK